MSDFKFEDSKPLTDAERRHLCLMLSRALVEMRLCCWEGDAAKAGDIADAFHNVPIHLFGETFSFNYFRLCLESYRHKHPGPGFDYLSMLDKFLEEEAERG
ncbi:MAG TPA: hypothetical protein VM914_01755 [Pyrinomonadaceae bacterium]|jgi:hypothetical protein|nr:hypothetical protein [Pyrinomonadaceae bacterium]